MFEILTSLLMKERKKHVFFSLFLLSVLALVDMNLSEQLSSVALSHPIAACTIPINSVFNG